MAAEILLIDYFGTVECCSSPTQLPDLIKNNEFDAVLLDMNFSPFDASGNEGFFWLKKILDIEPDMVVIMITAHAAVDLAVETMKHGATDFIAKPWQNERVIATLSSAVKLRHSQIEAKSLKQNNELLAAIQTSHYDMIGSSGPMVYLRSLIERTAPTDANVLILGENGTGKELVARELHHQSERQDKIFMSVDLGAISETLFESELFGHVKGAFTGANKDRVGRLVAANGGTLFLDEIGNIPLHLQAKLLTALEQRNVTPIGSNKSIAIDVRVISATNATRNQLTDMRAFRQDLLFRLNTVELNLPPLRERPEDILPIAQHYAHLYAHKYRKDEKSFSTDAVSALHTNTWPGNVRELRHAVERAVILSVSEQLTSQDLNLTPSEGSSQVYSGVQSTIAEKTVANQIADLEELNIEKMEAILIKRAMQKHDGNISQAAAELGLTRATLYRRIEKYGI